MTEAFAGLGDPRTGPARRHDLKEMILMALCAVLCGADTWVDVAEWAEDNEAWLKRYLRLEHGTPSHDTFDRLFRLLDAKVFEACFREWISDLAGVVAGVVAIDGKTACGSRDGRNTALHTVMRMPRPAACAWGRNTPAARATKLRPSKRCSTRWRSRAASSRSTPSAVRPRLPGRFSTGAVITCWPSRTTRKTWRTPYGNSSLTASPAALAPCRSAASRASRKITAGSKHARRCGTLSNAPSRALSQKRRVRPLR